MDNILYIARMDMSNPLWREAFEKEARVQDAIGRILVSTQIVGDYILAIFSKK